MAVLTGAMRQAGAAATLILVLALGVIAPTAGARSSSQTSAWYWTSGACKSELQKSGVRIGDGRTFNVAKAFCVGLHNHCWIDSGVRRYKVFIAVARSYDGVVRRFQLTVTGHHTWSGGGLKIIDSGMSATDFVATYGPAAWSVASLENQGGCSDVHP